jgi:F-type H+-transporting ATPase subunit delta
MNLAELARQKTVLDDEGRHVARVYAEALYRAAEKQGRQNEVLDDLQALVGQVFVRDKDFELFFASPAVARERKEEAIRRAFEGKADPLFTSFLLVLNKHGRLGMLRAIAVAYYDLNERRTGRLPVRVVSAVPLDEEQRRRLLEDVRAASGREPVLDEAIDPDLLGGMVVRVRDWVYDSSVRTRLEDIRTMLTERSSHAPSS